MQRQIPLDSVESDRTVRHGFVDNYVIDPSSPDEIIGPDGSLRPLTSLQQRLVKTGGRLLKHARFYWLLLAESHLTRRRFGTMLQRIWALPVPTG